MHATVSTQGGSRPVAKGGSRPAAKGGSSPAAKGGTKPTANRGTGPAADQDLVRSLGGFAKFLLHAGGRDFYRAVGELDLSISQIRTLHLLVGPLPEVSIKELADEIGLSLPAISRSVEGLVQRGLVTRTENTVDRRLKAVRATPQAHALVDHLIELRIAGIQDFVGTLTDSEQQKLAHALAPIVAREDIASMCIPRKDSPKNA
jgi:DNA-binding MarR family transcriptional regulator